MNVTPIAGGIVCVDVTDELPRHRTKRYQRRRRAIDVHFIHHSGKLGRDGYEGVRASAAYCIRRPTKTKPNGWPGLPYTYWVPWAPFRADDYFSWRDVGPDEDVIENFEAVSQNDLVYFRCNPDHLRTYHTGGVANARGVATCLQGNTSTDGMSDSQKEIMEAHIPYVDERHGILPLTPPFMGTAVDISWHSEAQRFGGKRKAACPGREAEQWLRDYRDAPGMP